MLVVVSLLYWAFFIISLPFMFVIALVVWAVTRPFDPDAKVSHRFTCIWGHFYLLCCPVWRMRVEGKERFPKGASVIVSNHESLVDIVVLFGLHHPFKWVSKQSNFKLPIIGHNMKLCRYIPVVRGDRSSVERMMEQCRYWLGRDIPVLIFPEGTRSKTGELGAFKDGAFSLALETGAPVVPVTLSGTGATLPKHGLILQGRMDARVQVLDPIDPARFDSVDSLRDATRDAMTEALSRRAVIS